MSLGRPAGIGKWEPREPSRKIKRNGSSVGAWCYRCKSEHRWEQPCKAAA